MPRLFSYGSLREPKVQLATFGRLLAGLPDELLGFELGRALNKQLANVTRASDSSRVAGMVFEVTPEELLAADRYERADAYVRMAVTLASGVEAWVYVYSCTLTKE